MLSVIVPVYQAADTLKRCVQSILIQAVDGMEIILVDDGSTDGSGELCDELSRKYENIVVKHIKNSGPYQARRQGVLNAKGDVITFVDADDWIEKNAYRELLEVYKKNEPDILLFAYRYGQDGESVFHEHEDGLYSKRKIEKQILPSMMCDIKLGRRRIDPSLCCKMIKKELFLKVTTDVEERIIWGEDAVVTYPMICAADSIFIFNEAFYHYCISGGSCTRNYPVERIKELQDFRRILERQLALSTDKNFCWQIDCYMRNFLDMLSEGWLGCRRVSQRFTFPLVKIKPGSKVKLYGAGDVGRAFYQLIVQTECVKLTGWFDKNADIIEEFCGEGINGLDELSLDDDEYLLIAVSSQRISDDIRNDLINRGIPNEKIIWEKPRIIC